MAREIVTSENREDYINKKMGKKEKKPKLTEHGLPIDKHGNVRLWHGTTKESAHKILGIK